MMQRYVDYQAVADIFEAMRTETVGGMSVAELVGGGYPLPVAAHFMDIVAEQAGLTQTDRVLDVGCGCGRLAAALTQHVGREGTYVGVDIVAGLIDFANRHIAPRYTNFRFLTLMQDNPAYDHWRADGQSSTIGSLREACPPGSIDLCLATSLFTHLDGIMAHRMLADIQAALHDNGRLVISLFLLDAGARTMMRHGRAAFHFEHPYGEGTYVQDPVGAGPLGAIAFTNEHFIELVTGAGLYIERVLYGSWTGRPHFVSGQDIVIIRKMPISIDQPQEREPLTAVTARSANTVRAADLPGHRQLVEDNRRLSAELIALHKSRSWRMTAPIRLVSRALGRH